MAGFQKRQRQAVFKACLYGGPGSGKTLTTLLLSEALAKAADKRVAYVDTEQGTVFYEQHVVDRKVHPEPFDIDVLPTRSIAEVLQAVRGLDWETHGVVCIDSATHLWEACRAAYEGRTNRAGQIPIYAWAAIKKPWKELMSLLLSCPAHVFILGREGDQYDTSEDGKEAQIVGKKMLCEKETQYEPHFVARMELRKCSTKSTSTRTKNLGGGTLEAIPTMMVEKDRIGCLTGRVIEWPNAASVLGPMLPYLGIRHDAPPSEHEAAARDARIFSTEEGGKQLRELLVKIAKASSENELHALGSGISPSLKGELSPDDWQGLRDAYSKRLHSLRQPPPGNRETFVNDDTDDPF